MQSRIEGIRQADADVLAVCVDPVEENAKVVEKLGLDFPILSDPQLTAIAAFGLTHRDAMTASGVGTLARPGVFLLDRGGVVRWRHLTDNWRIRVRPESVLKQLAAID